MVLQLFEKQNTLETQTNPQNFVLAHLALKSVQVGQAFAAIAALASVLKNRQLKGIFRNFTRALPAATFVAAIPTFGLGFFKMSKAPELNPKRKLLLQRNINQNTIDDMTVAGMLVGAALGLIGPFRLVRSTLVGGTLGVVAYSVNRWALRPYQQDLDIEGYVHRAGI